MAVAKSSQPVTPAQPAPSDDRHVPHVSGDYDPKSEKAHPDRVIAELASRQAGRVGWWQLKAADITRDEVKGRLASGHLHRKHRGVYVVGHLAPTKRSDYFAAWLALGPGAVVSHRAAAHELDLRTHEGSVVDVTVPRNARQRKGIRVHVSPLAEEDVVTIAGLPVTSWARTIRDLARNEPIPRITKLLERADKLGLYDHAAFRGATGKLRRALGAFDPRHDRTRSGWERDVLPLLDALGLPPPLINHQIGPYEFDLAWPAHGVVVELDSYEHHSDRAAFERDRDKLRWAQAQGLLPLPFTWRQVKDGKLAELVTALRVRAR